jgi:hypothetical protein
MPITDKDLKVEILFEDPFVPVAGLSSKWHKRRKIELAELVNEPWCLFDRRSFLSSIAAASCVADDPYRNRHVEEPVHRPGDATVH